MHIYIIFNLLILAVFSGCSFTNLNQMSIDEKRNIYKSIKSEIHNYKIDADMLYNTGYYADAAKAYEMINFYEGRIVIPLKKIRSIRLKGESNARYHYKKSLKYIKKNNIRAMFELNKMMKSDPDYKDGKVLFQSLKDDIKIQSLLNKLEISLQEALKRDREDHTNLKKINIAINDLSKYDITNPILIGAKNEMKSIYISLTNKAIDAYNRGSYSLAEKSFKNIKYIYPEDTTSKKYFANIYAKKDLRTTLQKAEEALNKKDFLTVISLCNKVKEYEPSNKEAENMAKTAKNEYKKQIPKIINKGKSFYYKQDFKNAKTTFKSILTCDPNNPTSLAYLKKIDRQIKTIESLR